jgi:hypothetical protein
MDKEDDEECHKWAIENALQHVIPIPRQVESISEYSDAEQDVLLGLGKFWTLFYFFCHFYSFFAQFKSRTQHVVVIGLSVVVGEPISVPVIG